MHKSKGNAVEPFTIMNKYGADTVRMYLAYVSPTWTPLKFDEDGLKEVHSKFFNPLKNTYTFFRTYANIDNVKISECNVPVSEREEILAVHAKNKTFDESVNLKNLSQRTPGFSGADLENLLNESALLAVRRDKEAISIDEIMLIFKKTSNDVDKAVFEKMMKDADSNGDGSIEFDEFQNIMEKFFQ